MTRSILITGCSSGIGYDAAHRLSAMGWQVLATCRKPEDCERLLGEGLESFPLDYADPQSIRDGVAETLARTGGRLDALFNNGAWALPGAAEDLPREGLRAIFEANVFGWHDLTQQVIPTMRAQGHGRIIQNSSVLGFVSFNWRGAYSATKYAIEGLSDALRLEMADTGIDVVLIQPGPIATKIRENSIDNFERWIDWEGSARVEQYRDTLLKRLYVPSSGKDKFELPASAVTDVLIKALEAKRPRARYRVTTPTKILSVAKRILPGRMLDHVLSKAS
ncbi:MAG: SDR family NAD(P)-dependent oxidoreductase [Mangrovicoccus sp.]|nr:SDR family NAD(P)-dependent oxidoreductase [Mangrovicoccus sp.]